MKRENYYIISFNVINWNLEEIVEGIDGEIRKCLTMYHHKVDTDPQ